MTYRPAGGLLKTLAAFLILAFGIATFARAAIIGNFDLTGGTYANSFGSLGALSPVSSGGTYAFNSGGWTWSGATAPGTGVTVGGLPANDGATFGSYSIGIRFSLGQVTGYRRLVQYQSSSDYGQYVVDGQFQLYNNAQDSTGGSITANNTVDFVLTRDAGSRAVNAYLNGNSTPIFTFTDTSDSARTDNLRTLQFFRDDGIEFSTSGTASLIRIWDAPLAAIDIPGAMMIPVPEPATAALVVVAATSALLLRMRTRRRAA